MVKNKHASDISRARLKLLEELDSSADPQQVILDRLVGETERVDPVLGTILRACSISRRFDAEIIGVLREQPDDREENERLLNRLRSYSFVTSRKDGTYVYHDTVRDGLLHTWLDQSANLQFETYNQRLIDYYENEVLRGGVELSEAFNRVEQLLRDASPERHTQIAELVETQVTVPLLEALYHSTLLSPEKGFSFFEKYFYPYETQGRITICRMLLSTLRDCLERLDLNHNSKPEFFLWMDYFEARIILDRKQYAEAEERLRRLLSETGKDVKLKFWIQGSLGQALRAQNRLRESRAVYDEAASISRDNSMDLFNLSAMLNNVADLDYVANSLSCAEKNYRQAVVVAHEYSNQIVEVTATLGLSAVLQDRGELGEAVDCAFRALNLVRTQTGLQGDRDLAQAVSKRFMQLGTPDSAQLLDTLYEECRALTSLLGDPDAQTSITESYLDCLRRTGQTRRAQELIGSLKLFGGRSEASAGTETRTESLFVAANISEDLGQSAQAVECYDRILSLGLSAIGVWDWLRALSARGVQRTVLAHFQDAERDLREAERGWRELEQEALAAGVRVRVADTLRKRGEYDDAQALLRDAVEILERHKSTDLLDWQNVQADLYCGRGDWREAQERYANALASAATVDVGRAAHLAVNIAVVAARAGDWSNAAQRAAEAAELFANLRAMDNYHQSAEAKKADQINGQGVGYLVDPRSERPGRVMRAAALFEDAADLAPENCWYRLNLSYANAELGNWSEAAEALDKALNYMPTSIRSNWLKECLIKYYGNAAAAIVSSNPSNVVVKLDVDTRIIRRALELNTGNKPWMDKLSQLESRRRWIVRFGQNVFEIPVSTPIIVEISDDLVPKVDNKQDQGRFLFGYVPQMRDKLKSEFGLPIPGLRMRGNPNLVSGSYVVMIDEIPVYRGSIQPDLFFCTSEASTELRDLPSTIHIVDDPLTKENGAWLSRDQASALSGYGLVLYTDAAMLIRHIEVILCRHLSFFLGLQEAEALLDDWSKDDSLAKRVQTTLPDTKSRLGFARLLRTLVREQIPITQPQEILAAIEALPLDPDGIAAAVRAVRLRLKSLLPANTEKLHRVDASPELEHSVKRWLTREEGRIKYNIPPQAAYELLEDIRKLVSSVDERSVLVVRDPELRPFLQRMVDFSLPFLLVQSQEELEQPSE